MENYRHFKNIFINTFPKETFASKLMDSGRALAFKPDNPNLYLVGSDEGDIFLCTTEYASESLASFQAMNCKYRIYHLAIARGIK